MRKVTTVPSPGDLRGKRWQDPAGPARTLSLEGSSRRCPRRDGGWDARAVRATGRASRHPGRERGTVMKSSISWSAAWFITTRKRTPTRSSPEHPGRWRCEPARLADPTRADNRRCCLPLEQPEVAHRGMPKFMLDAEELQPGLTIYRRPGGTREIWHAKFKLGEFPGIRLSSKFTDKGLAKRWANKRFEEMKERYFLNLPLFPVAVTRVV